MVLQSVFESLWQSVKKGVKIPFAALFFLSLSGPFLFQLGGCSKPRFGQFSSKRYIEGQLALGRSSQSTINLYKLLEGGGRGSLIQTVLTDSGGRFELFCEEDGPVELVALGGTFVDGVSGATVSVGTREIRSLLTGLTQRQSVVISPLTQMASDRALSLMADGLTTAEAIALSLEQLQEVSGISDIQTTPLGAGETIQANTAPASISYSLLLMGFSSVAQAKGVDLLTLMESFTKDFSEDGILDAANKGRFILLEGSSLGLLDGDWSEALLGAMNGVIGDSVLNTKGFTSAHKPTLTNYPSGMDGRGLGMDMYPSSTAKQIMVISKSSMILNECVSASLVLLDELGEPAFDKEDRALYLSTNLMNSYYDANCTQAAQTLVVPAFNYRSQFYLKVISLGDAYLLVSDFAMDLAGSFQTQGVAGTPPVGSINEDPVQFNLLMPSILPQPAPTALCWPASVEWLNSGHELTMTASPMTLTLTETLNGSPSSTLSFYKDPQCSVPLDGGGKTISVAAHERSVTFFFKASTLGAYVVAIDDGVGGGGIASLAQTITIYDPSGTPTPPSASAVTADAVELTGVSSYSALSGLSLPLSVGDCHPLILRTINGSSGEGGAVTANETIALAGQVGGTQFFKDPFCSGTAVNSLTILSNFSSQFIYVKYGASETQIDATPSTHPLWTADSLLFTLTP